MSLVMFWGAKRGIEVLHGNVVFRRVPPAGKILIHKASTHGALPNEQAVNSA